MGFLFVFILLLLVSYYLAKKNIGALLCLSTLFPEIFGAIFHNTGLSGVNMLFRYLIYIIIIIFSIQKRHIFTKWIFTDIFSIAFFILIATMIWHNYYYIGRARSDANVAAFQFNIILRMVIPYILILITAKNRQVLKQFVQSIPVWGLLFLAVFYLLIGLEGVDTSDRLTIENSTGFNSIGLSRLAIIIFISSSTMLFVGKQKMLSFFIFFISLFTILLASQRASLAGAIIALLLLYLILVLKKGVSIKHIIILLISFLIIVPILQSTDFEIFHRFDDLGDYEQFQRYADYGRSWQIFSHNNYLTGEGSMGYYYYTNFTRDYPHSIILELMAEYGLVGLVYALLLIIGGTRLCLSILKNTNMYKQYKVLPAIWIAFLPSVLLSCSFLYNSVFILLTAYILILNNLKNNGETVNITNIRRIISLLLIQRKSRKWKNSQ